MRMLKHAFGVSAAVCAVLLLAPGTARASSITFIIDCSINGAGTCGAPTGNFGTITLTDSTINSNWVDLSISLTTPPNRLINKFFLNFDPLQLPVPSGYTFTATGSNVHAAADSEGQGAYGMVFDIVGTTNPAVNPLTATIKLERVLTGALIDIDAEDFNFTDTQYGHLYAAINYSGAGGQVGASTSIVGTAVPEPATLSLLGLGLAGLVGHRRRRVN